MERAFQVACIAYDMSIYINRLVAKVTSNIQLQKYLSWSKRSTNRRIFAATILIGIITLTLNLVSMLREMVVAHQFGAGDEVDAYLIAFLLPSFVVNVVAGSFNAALIPTYIQTRENNGQGAAQQLFSSVMLWSTALLVLASVFLALAIHYILPILASGFNADKLALAQSLFFVLLPIITISGIVTIWSSVLNAGERFVMGALAPVMVPVVTLVFLFILKNRLGIYSLALGTVAGSILQCVLLAIALRRQNILLLPRWYGVTEDLKKVFRQYLPMIGGAFMMSGTSVINQAMATWLAPGSVSALNYGSKISTLMTGLATTALGTAALPYLAQHVAARDSVSLRHIYYTYTKLILWITIPVTLMFILFSNDLVRLLFERGAFDVSTSGIVSLVQQCYLLQLPFYVLGTLEVRMISSFSANHIIARIAVSNFLITVAANYIFMKLIGLPGIALSTSIVYLISAAMCHFVVMRKLNELDNAVTPRTSC